MGNIVARAFQYRIYPSPEQEVLFVKTFGCCRFVWNLMLNDRIESYKSTGKQQDFTPAMYKTEDRPFLCEVDSMALDSERQDLRKAFNNFFAKRAKFPKFKRKHDSKNCSFRTNNVNNSIVLDCDNKCIKFPKAGFVKLKLHRPLPEGAIIKNSTVRKEPSGKWFCSICFEVDEDSLKTKRKTRNRKAEKLTVGLDYKSDGLYVDSEGDCANMPHFYRKAQKALAKAQRKLSRMKPHSKNWYRQNRKVAILHEKVANQRRDFLHKKAKELADKYKTICVEDLNLQAIAQSLKLGKATHDNGFGMFRLMLAYKLSDRDGELIRAPKLFASSQICHCCGEKNPEVKDVKVRKWTCPHCGAEHDRDENAAINLKQYALGLNQSK